MSRARLLIPLAAFALLVGCGMPSPAVASKVGDASISERTVSDLSASCEAVVKQPPSSLRTITVVQLTRAEIARQLAAKHGIDVSDGTVDGAVAQVVPQQVELLPTACGPLVRAGVIVTIVGSQLQQSFLDEAEALSPTLNPRYGKWDPTQLAPKDSASLSQLAGDR